MALPINFINLVFLSARVHSISQQLVKYACHVISHAKNVQDQIMIIALSAMIK